MSKTLMILAALSLLFSFGQAAPAASKYFKDPQVRALAVAAADGNAVRVDRLVKEKVDVNAVGEEGMTPLAFTMMSLNKKGFEALLERGANPNVEVPNLPITGKSLMHLAAQGEDIFWLRALVKHGGNVNLEMAGQSPIFNAMMLRRVANVRFLVENGADIELRRGGRIETPLLYATMHTLYDSMFFLLEKGADFRARGYQDTTIEFHLLLSARNPGILRTTENWKWRTKSIEWLVAKGVVLDPEIIESTRPSATGK